MTIKKREKTLTPEEQKIKMKNTYAPFWFNSEVLFGADLYPVSESFSQGVTVLFLMDVADFTSERISEFLLSWNIRYSKLPWSAVIVFQQKYAFMKNNSFIEKYRNHKVFLDPFGELFERFGSGKEPVAVILKAGQLATSMPLLPDLSKSLYQLESEFQRILRSDDTGLPLPSIEKWNKTNAPMQQSTFVAKQVTTSGKWSGNEDMIFSEDNNSSISISFKGKVLRMVAMAHPNALEPVRTKIMFNDKPIYKDLQGPLIHEDNTGSTTLEINKTTGIYDLILSDHEISGIFKITFPNLYDVGVVFYEFKTS